MNLNGFIVDLLKQVKYENTLLCIDRNIFEVGVIFNENNVAK